MKLYRPEVRECHYCHKHFERTGRQERFCSFDCSTSAKAKRYRIKKGMGETKLGEDLKKGESVYVVNNTIYSMSHIL